MTDIATIVGPLGDLQAQVMPISMSVTLAAKVPKKVEILKDPMVMKFLPIHLAAGVDNLTIICGGTVHFALGADSWGTPTDTTLDKTIGSIPGADQTTLYTPRGTFTWWPGLSKQIKPKVQLGEPPAIYLYSTTVQTVTIRMDLHVHGLTAPIPWDVPP
jgi:hypothetical protein